MSVRVQMTACVVEEIPTRVRKVVRHQQQQPRQLPLQQLVATEHVAQTQIVQTVLISATQESADWKQTLNLPLAQDQQQLQVSPHYLSNFHKQVLKIG